jgi:hypothetical protein
MAPRLTRTAFEYSLSPVSQGEDSPNTFPAAPADEHAPSQLGSQVDGVGDLADGEAPDVAVVVGESAVAEHGAREARTCRPRSAHDAAKGKRSLSWRLTLGGELSKLAHRRDRIQGLAHPGAEDVNTLPTDAPEPEREPVVTLGLVPRHGTAPHVVMAPRRGDSRPGSSAAPCAARRRWCCRRSPPARFPPSRRSRRGATRAGSGSG